MRVALRLRDQLVHRQHILLHLVGNIQMITDQMLDVMHAAVVMMVMIMAVLMVMMVVMLFMIMVMVMLIMVMVMIMVFMVMIFVVMVVMMVMMIMHMFIMCLFFLTMNRHRHMRPVNAALSHDLIPEFNTGDVQRIQFFHHFFRMRKQLQKCCSQHIAGRPHSKIKV